MPTELRPERAYQAQVMERMGVAALVDLAAQEPDQEITLSIERADFAEDASRYPAAIYVWPADALSYDGGSLVLHLSAALPDAKATVAPLWVGRPRLAIEGEEVFCKLELAGRARLRHQWLYSRHAAPRTILIDGELAPEPYNVQIFHAVALTEPATRLVTNQAAEKIRIPLDQTALRTLAAADLAEHLVGELDRVFRARGEGFLELDRDRLSEKSLAEALRASSTRSRASARGRLSVAIASAARTLRVGEPLQPTARYPVVLVGDQGAREAAELAITIPPARN